MREMVKLLVQVQLLPFQRSLIIKFHLMLMEEVELQVHKQNDMVKI